MRDLKALFYLFIPVYYIYVASLDILIAKRSAITLIIGGIASIFVTLIVILRPEGLKYYKIAGYFLLYLFILIAFSSDRFISSKIYLGVYIPIMMLFAGYSIVKNFDEFKKLNRSIIILMIFYLINLTVFNLFNLGKPVYTKENIWLTGNAFAEGLNSMAYALILVPYFIQNSKDNKNKIKIYFGAAVIIITIVITMKRISIVAVIAGYLVYLLMTGNKKKNIRIMVAIGSLMILAYPLYKDKLQKQYEARIDRFDTKFIESEARYIETQNIWEEVFSFKNPIKSLFGQEIFNSKGKYSRVVNKERLIHVDYNLVLHGAGIVGLILFLLLHLRFIVVFYRLKNILKNIYYHDCNIESLLGIYISFVVMSLVISFSGGMNSVVFNSVKYVYLGAISSILVTKIKEYYCRQ